MSLFEVPIHGFDLPQVLDRLEGWIRERKGPHLIVTPDTTALMQARWDATLLEAYKQADLVTPDGIGLVWAARLLGTPLPTRVSGIDILEAFCRRAAEQGYRVFFLGAAPGVAEEAAQKLQARYPGLPIVGTQHGYFTPEEEPQLLREIQRKKPDALFVGLGVPKQELWMLRHRDALDGVPVVMGVGGSFDVLSGRLPRAPESWQRLGLEWLWRALREPQRLRRVRVIPLFLLEVLALRAAQLWVGSSLQQG